jgi:Tol biopolymer transport system component
MRRAWAAAVFALGAMHCGSGKSDSGAVDLPDRSTTTNGGDGGAGDAGTDDSGFPPEGDATTNTSGDRACDPTKPFGAYSYVFDPAFRSSTPRLSPDELDIYFTSADATSSTGSDLWHASRASKSAPWGTPEMMAKQSSPQNDNDPAVSSDELTLVFHSARTGNAELYWASRNSPMDDFGLPSLIPTVNDATVADAHAYLANDGLYFVSMRGGSTTYRIHRAPKSGNGFGTPALVNELSGAWNDWQPMVTEDGLTMLFASDRPDAKALGNYDLWLASRASVKDPWGNLAPITELNSTDSDQAGWISADRCRIWFSSPRNSTVQHVYFASRPL